VKRSVSVGAVVIGLALASCGGDGKKATTSPAPPDTVETPREGAPPGGSPEALPPEFLECMADQGFDISSPDDIHSAPTQMLQACFGSLHEGGGAP
jgi:hypothetical protein